MSRTADPGFPGTPRDGAATVLLVHGAWHDASCWVRVIGWLHHAGIRTQTVDLPSCGHDPNTLGDLHADVTTVRAVLNGIAGPVVLCAHSYGGVVITEAAAGARNVRQLVYLAAYMPDEAGSLLSCLGGEDPPSYVDAREDGTVAIRPDMAIGTLYNDLPPDDAMHWAARLSLHSHAAVSTPVTAAAWRTLPSTYVVATGDHSIAPEVQRAMARRAGTVVEWATSHTPFLSQPHLVADLLTTLATGAEDAGT